MRAPFAASFEPTGATAGAELLGLSGRTGACLPQVTSPVTV